MGRKHFGGVRKEHWVDPAWEGLGIGSAACILTLLQAKLGCSDMCNGIAH